MCYSLVICSYSKSFRKNAVILFFQFDFQQILLDRAYVIRQLIQLDQIAVMQSEFCFRDYCGIIQIIFILNLKSLCCTFKKTGSGLTTLKVNRNRFHSISPILQNQLTFFTFSHSNSSCVSKTNVNSFGVNKLTKKSIFLNTHLITLFNTLLSTLFDGFHLAAYCSLR